MKPAPAPGQAPARSRSRRPDSTGTGGQRPGPGWFTLDRILSIVVPVVLLAMALTPLQPVYLDPMFFGTVAGGLVLGTVIAVLGAMLRWHTLTVLAVALPVFFLSGALAAPTTALGGVLPTPTTVQVMGRGMVTVWKEVLTIAPPLGSGGALLLLPYVLAFTGALVAVTIALRARRYSLSLIVPALVLIAAILFGTHLSVLAGLFGVSGVLLSLTWVAWRAGRLELNRVLAITVVLGVAAVGGTGAAVALAPTDPRLVLRDFVEPPPDPHDYPSPLAGYRLFVDDLAEETVFTVSGLPGGTEALRLAAMESYDGMVWDVTPDHTPATGTFTRIGDRITVEVPEDPAQMQITIDALRGVWIPNIGDSVDVDFTSERSAQLSEGFYYNSATHTALSAPGLRSGDSYTLTAAQPDPPPEFDAADLVAQDLSMPEPRNVPDIVGTLASQYADGYTNDYARVEAIASNLSTSGFFSHGLVNEVPSRPGHGAGRMIDMLDAEQMVGNDEQYAAAMALMVRALGYPARVVMGFEVDPQGGGTQEIVGDDVAAWVEVPFEDHGWLPFYPTPDEDQVPQAEDPDPVDLPQPQVLQPPPPPQEPPDVPPQDRDDADIEDETPDEDSVVGPWLMIVGVTGLSLLVLLSPFLVIVALKVLRRRRRRKAKVIDHRIAGAWTELEDQAVDLGTPRAPGRTRQESARVLDAAFTGANTKDLAGMADAGVFGPSPPRPEAADRFWAEVARARRRLRDGVGRRRRFRSHFSAKSLRRRGR